MREIAEKVPLRELADRARDELINDFCTRCADYDEAECGDHGCFIFTLLGTIQNLKQAAP